MIPWVYANETSQDREWAPERPTTVFWVCLTSRKGQGTGPWIPLHGQWLNQSCLWNKTPLGTAHQSSVELPGWWIHQCAECDMSWCHRERVQKLCVQDHPDLILCVFIWLVLIYILHNKTVVISRVLSWVLWVVLMNQQTWGSWDSPKLIASLSEVQLTWGPPNLWLVSEVRAVLLRAVPLTCGIYTIPHGWCQNGLQYTS